MKSVWSLTLIASLMALTTPTSAQERVADTASGPIARAMARQAVRLASDPQAGSAPIDWAQVRRLAPSSEVAITVKGSGDSTPALRRFVSADDTTLILLNVAPLPRAASQALLEAASRHPERFAMRDQAWAEWNLRVGPEGVFFEKRRVADLDQVVERIQRTDVIDILPGPFRTDWSSVPKIATDTEVVLTVRGHEAEPGIVLRATDVGLIFLNLSSPTLPASTKRALKASAATHPEYFDEVREKGGTFLLGTNVRLTRDGVFASDRPVADLAQLIEDVARPSVVEIRARQGGGQPMSSGAKGALIGAAVGGVWSFAGVAAGQNRCDECGLAVLLGVGVCTGIGALVGWAAGGKARDDVQGIIYRVP